MSLKHWNGSELQIDLTKRGIGTHYYKVTLIDGPMPDAADLIALCDGGRHNYGGKVEDYGDMAFVEVYID